MRGYQHGPDPLAGVLMGTRCGDVDPSVVTHGAEKWASTAEEMADYLNKHCGLLGVSGVSSDKRDVGGCGRRRQQARQARQRHAELPDQKIRGRLAAAMGA